MTFTVMSVLALLAVSSLVFMIAKLRRDSIKIATYAAEVGKLMQAVEQSPDMVIITNPKAQIEYVNPAFTQMTGYTREEVIGKNPRFLKSGHTARGEYKQLWDTITSGKIWRGEFHNRKKDSSSYWSEASIAPVFNQEGVVTQYIGIQQDITDRKKIEEKLDAQKWGLEKTNEGIRLLYKELEQKNQELSKLDEMKSSFVSTVSHELRTPLTIVREGVSQVVDGLLGETTEKQKQFLRVSLDGIDRLSRIIDELLDISKLEAGKSSFERGSVDLVEIVREVASSFKTMMARKSLELKTSFSSASIDAFADRDKLVQVFTNLINNALKFTHKGSITVSVEEQDKVILCRVADTGEGIDKPDLPKVFEKFQQFNRTAGPGDKGTGLGLAIVKGIIRLHRGEIWVESEVGQGTTFSFTLPKYTPQKLLEEHVSLRVREAVKEETALSLVAIRIQNFDAFVHKMGEKIATMLVYGACRLIQTNLRRRADQSMAIGDTILVVLPGLPKEAAVTISWRLRYLVEQDLLKKELPEKAKLISEVACFPEDGCTGSELLKRVCA